MVVLLSSGHLSQLTTMTRRLLVAARNGSGSESCPLPLLYWLASGGILLPGVHQSAPGRTFMLQSTNFWRVGSDRGVVVFFFFLSQCPFLLALAVLSSLLILFQTVISVFAAHTASHRSLVRRVIVPCANVVVVPSWPDGCYGKTGSSVRLPSQHQGRQRKDKIAVSPLHHVCARARQCTDWARYITALGRNNRKKPLSLYRNVKKRREWTHPNFAIVCGHFFSEEKQTRGRKFLIFEAETFFFALPPALFRRNFKPWFSFRHLIVLLALMPAQRMERSRMS